MLTEALPKLRGRLQEKASLAEYTAWKVGGPADFLYVPADLNDLIFFLEQLPLDIPMLWLGLGSNVLIRDGGVAGVVIVTQGALNQINQLEPQIIRAEAGVSCAQLARYTARLGLTGVEFMAGIPGTVGGALVMNAGCYGGETWQRIRSVETINRLGEKKLRSRLDFQVHYRQVERPQEEWFVAGHFELASGEKNRSLETIRLLLEKRHASQPTNMRNCGSVFRNPIGHFAAQLIEACGLKDRAIGGASVSTKHANFIINDGTATAADIENLIYEIAKVVEEEQGISLIPEVHIIGRE